MKKANRTINKVNVSAIILILALLMTVGAVSALNAKIGNGRVVLHVKTGETVERTIKVINDNNISVRINFMAQGDLKDYVVFKDNNFTLTANETKDAGFTIKSPKDGKTETQIDVMFTPVEGKNGIVLPATVIMFADKNGNGSINYGNETIGDGEGSSKNMSGTTIAVIVITIIIVVVLLALLAVYFAKKNMVIEKDGKLNEKKKTK